MMKVSLICMSSLKEKYLREASAEYCKRLSRYCRLCITELLPERLPEQPSSAQISAALEKEAGLITKAVPQNAFSVALCIEGKRMTSENFAQTVDRLSAEGRPLALIIGSSYGLSPRIKESADLRLSLSDMTFPHQLFRIMLLEQLYRAYRINGGGSYHK